jgi:hypothetical protein
MSENLIVYGYLIADVAACALTTFYLMFAVLIKMGIRFNLRLHTLRLSRRVLRISLTALAVVEIYLGLSIPPESELLGDYGPVWLFVSAAWHVFTWAAIGNVAQNTTVAELTGLTFGTEASTRRAKVYRWVSAYVIVTGALVTVMVLVGG